MPLPRKAWQALKDVQRALESGRPIETEDWTALAIALERITELGASPDDDFGYRPFDHKPPDHGLRARQWRMACAVLDQIVDGVLPIAEAKRRARSALAARRPFSRPTEGEINRAWKLHGGRVRAIARTGRNPRSLLHFKPDPKRILNHTPRPLSLK